jgi:hypothetical protein
MLFHVIQALFGVTLTGLHTADGAGISCGEELPAEGQSLSTLRSKLHQVMCTSPEQCSSSFGK